MKLIHDHEVKYVRSRIQKDRVEYRIGSTNYIMLGWCESIE